MDPITTPSKAKHKILYLVAEPGYFYSHRYHLAIASLKAGYEVALLTRTDNNKALIEKIESAGIQVFSLKHFKRANLNPLNQLRTLAELYNVYRNYKPDIVHQVALKPVLYGSFISKICHVPKVINALGGLGYLFTTVKPSSGASHQNRFKKEILKKIIFPFLKWVFRQKNSMLILQNTDDQKTLLDHNLINPKQTIIIRGAGVDLEKFKVMPFLKTPPIRIVCVSRLLWDKGIGELIDAIQYLKTDYAIELIVYGCTDPENPQSINEKQLQNWQQLKYIRWAGHCEDIASAYAQAHIAVLPSYREGLPKCLLEAASCGRPIVTTDVPGCREIVKNDENGLLVPPKDSLALAHALVTLIVNNNLREKMGRAGRLRVERYFSNDSIQKKTLMLYE